MTYEIDEILNEAVMTGVPSVIVEGVDDICIYSEIAKDNTPFSVEVYAVEHISGFGEGCEEVLRAISEIEAIRSSKHKTSDHVLGIIDKDVRDFRGEAPESEAVLMLKHYSIESHFVSQTIVQYALKTCTRSSHEMITNELCDFITREIEGRLLRLYYFSLEALKKSLVRNYDAAFCYSYGYGRLKDERAKELITAKKDELDAFAAEKNIEKSIVSLKGIARGKWLIDVFAEELVLCINDLQGLCKDSAIESCRSCLNQAFDKCLYKVREGVNKNTIKSIALSNITGPEFVYIAQRISSLKGSVVSKQGSIGAVLQ
ncbi:hypothetical protein [Stutzerimonas nitrititolerans]|uniref:hypothetical protein n=1 Tax=Stutzerimonas nitrititolerans TaxID=2482751 RepID=UPI0028AB0454|nr:hypothetical protein [Stutzerimonas nitrititolerans]